MKTRKNDFVEIEFTGKIKDSGQIFDTTDKKEAEKINLKIDSKPLIICIGQKMLVPGFDKELEGKELGKKYIIEVSPEEGFGKRNPALIKTLPIKIFHEKNMDPKPGMMFQLDNFLVRISAVSGGRVIADFNNPLAGKTLIYEFKIKRKITDQKEKIKTLSNLFFKKELEFEIKDKKIIFKIENKELADFVKIFKNKFKEILGLELETKIEATTHKK